jgi:hypothetical protein
MQKVKEELILRILAQESLSLELWLERYEGLKFRGLFCIFSGARDLSGNSFKKPGPLCKNHGSRVDYPKVQGPFYKIFE